MAVAVVRPEMAVALLPVEVVEAETVKARFPEAPQQRVKEMLVELAPAVVVVAQTVLAERERTVKVALVALENYFLILPRMEYLVTFAVVVVAAAHIPALVGLVEDRVVALALVEVQRVQRPRQTLAVVAVLVAGECHQAAEQEALVVQA